MPADRRRQNALPGRATLSHMAVRATLPGVRVFRMKAQETRAGVGNGSLGVRDRVVDGVFAPARPAAVHVRRTSLAGVYEPMKRPRAEARGQGQQRSLVQAGQSRIPHPAGSDNRFVGGKAEALPYRCLSGADGAVGFVGTPRLPQVGGAGSFLIRFAG